jgi:translation initiation factor IF-1
MPRDSHVKMSGKVTDVHPGGQFTVELEQGHAVKAKLCGDMRKNRIRVILHDLVDVALSPYDLSHGIITYRYK